MHALAVVSSIPHHGAGGTSQSLSAVSLLRGRAAAVCLLMRIFRLVIVRFAAGLTGSNRSDEQQNI